VIPYHGKRIGSLDGFRGTTAGRESQQIDQRSLGTRSAARTSLEIDGTFPWPNRSEVHR